MSIFDMPWATENPVRDTLIPSYLYVQYNDDQDLLAFVAAQNALVQEYVAWFANIGLPIYTSDLITQDLLDWVGTTIYGVPRPVLPSGSDVNIGALNTFALNEIEINGWETVRIGEYYATTDDVYKRCITWNFYKGDGRIFDVRWLKRRVMRFLLGSNGVDPPVDETYRISVTFGVDNQVTIRILPGSAEIVGGAVCNLCGLNEVAFNEIETVFTPFDELEFAPVLQAAAQGGALQLPFQYAWTVAT